jgi:hypothetical protein
VIVFDPVGLIFLLMLVAIFGLGIALVIAVIRWLNRH